MGWPLFGRSLGIYSWVNWYKFRQKFLSVSWLNIDGKMLLDSILPFYTEKRSICDFWHIRPHFLAKLRNMGWPIFGRSLGICSLVNWNKFLPKFPSVSWLNIDGKMLFYSISPFYTEKIALLTGLYQLNEQRFCIDFLNLIFL